MIMTVARRKETVLSGKGRLSPPRGFVPVVVGAYDDDEDTKRFFVHVKLLKDPFIIELLEMAAEEFGYRQEGVLRIPCKIEHFMRTVDEIYRN
ncbi:Auxin-induced protein 10A5 [Dendrobium catenatum]|uniref:Auxin-induced protein 10A5 n=1 Tax=Dendrobium catenatum TaxID=906689 RepID=A0A2I0VR14_9ASPA|nr:Auxin-induced protein 10A5 [Dendrobium catenatum]